MRHLGDHRVTNDPSTAYVEKVLTEQQRDQLEILRLLCDGHAEAEVPCPNPDECQMAAADLAIIDALLTHGVERERKSARYLDAYEQADREVDDLNRAGLLLELTKARAQRTGAERDRDYWKSTAFREQGVHQQAARDRDAAESRLTQAEATIARVRAWCAPRWDYFHDRDCTWRSNPVWCSCGNNQMRALLGEETPTR
jgi:hypothetical protein